MMCEFKIPGHKPEGREKSRFFLNAVKEDMRQ